MLVTALVLFFTPFNGAFAETITEEPTIKSITMDKKDVTTGDTVSVSIKINGYENYDYIILYYISPITGNSMNLSLNFNSQSMAYEGDIPIHDHLESGSYTPYRISLYGLDVTSIESSEYKGFGDGAFTVTGTSGKSPIENIQVNKSEVTIGETVKVSLKVGMPQLINYLNVYYETPSNKWLSVSLHYNADTQLFEGVFPITAITEFGNYKLKMLSTYEVGDITSGYSGTQYENSFLKGDFNVYGTNAEDIIKDINIDRNEVNTGNQVNITVKTTETAGINYMNVYYKSPISDKSFSVGVYYNPAIDAYEGSLTVPNHFEEGLYKLFMLSIYDTAGNTVGLYESEYGQKFENGNFQFYRDVTSPSVPTVAEVTDSSTVVLGTAEVDSSIQIKTEATELGAGIVDAQGNYSIVINNQKAGTELTITATDAAGNTSEKMRIKVKDCTAPLSPVVDELNENTSSVTGEAESGSTIFIKSGTTILGTGIAADGKFAITIPKQIARTGLTVVAIDEAGNISEAINIETQSLPATPVNMFTDVQLNYRFANEILFLVDQDVISGYKDSTFRPNEVVTRGAAAIMIGRALDLTEIEGDNRFSDVNPNTVAAGYIAAAVKEGIISGFEDHTYRPNETVTRGQMAILIDRAFEISSTTPNTFIDMNPKMVSFYAVSRIAGQGIASGYLDNSYRPNEQLSRGQFSAFLARALNPEFIKK